MGSVPPPARPPGRPAGRSTSTNRAYRSSYYAAAAVVATAAAARDRDGGDPPPSPPRPRRSLVDRLLGLLVWSPALVLGGAVLAQPLVRAFAPTPWFARVLLGLLAAVLAGSLAVSVGAAVIRRRRSRR
jgi:hypothetical protein